MKIDCLDKGYVELLSHTPDGDLLVVNAARCSFDKQHEEFDFEKDAKLINYLARERHVLPFRHPNVTLRIHAPLFVLRQLGKHQVGFSWSEVSRRYIDSEPEFYSPVVFRARPDKGIKQGSKHVEPFGKNDFCRERYDNAEQVAYNEYKRLLTAGVAPEMARAILPQSMYTTTVTTGTLLGWHHMYQLRTEEHTQYETQRYAKAVDLIIKELYPISWTALKHNV